MEYAIEFGRGPEDVALVTSGAASADAFDRMIRELVGDPRFRPGMTILVDHTDLDLNALTDADVRHVAETTREVAAVLQSAFLVIVTPTVIGFSLSQMWQRLVAGLPIRAHVAMSREEAEARLRQHSG